MKTIQLILKDWKKEVGARGVAQFKIDRNRKTLILYTHHVKKYESLLEKYLNILRDKTKLVSNVEFVETNYYWV